MPTSAYAAVQHTAMQTSAYAPYGDTRHYFGLTLPGNLRRNFIDVHIEGAGTYLHDRTKSSGPHTPALFTAETAAQLEAAPALVHFTGPPTITPGQLLNPYVRPPSKPWALVCLNPFKSEWYMVLDMTPWGGWRPDERSFAKAAVDELLTLCRQLQQPARLSLRAPDGSVAVKAAAQVLQDQGCEMQQQDSQCVVDQAAKPSTVTPSVADTGAVPEGAACGHDCAPGGTVLADNGCLSGAVCLESDFDAQLFLRNVAAMCSAAAGAYLVV